MKPLKSIDLIIQGILLAGGVIYGVSSIDNGHFLNAYYALGSWQVISWLLHMLDTNNLFFRKERSAYGKTLLWLLLIGMLSYFSMSIGMPFLIFYLIVLLIISPGLGIWYFIICWREIALLNKKALVHLK